MQVEIEQYREQLSQPLKNFIDDYKTWNQENKSKIKISGLSILVQKLPDEMSEKYNGSVGYYLDCYTVGRETLRYMLCNCIKTIQISEDIN